MKPLVRELTVGFTSAECPRCGTEGKRHSWGTRNIKTTGVDREVVLRVRHAKYWCPGCRKYFSQDMTHLAPKYSRYSNRVIKRALHLAAAGRTYDTISHVLWVKYYVKVPPTTVFDMVTSGKFKELLRDKK